MAIHAYPSPFFSFLSLFRAALLSAPTWHRALHLPSEHSHPKIITIIITIKTTKKRERKRGTREIIPVTLHSFC